MFPVKCFMTSFDNRVQKICNFINVSIEINIENHDSACKVEFTVQNYSS